MNAHHPAAQVPMQVHDLILLELRDSDDDPWHYMCRILWLTPKGLGVRLPEKAVLPKELRRANGIQVTRVSFAGTGVTVAMLEVVSTSPLILAIGNDERPASLADEAAPAPRPIGNTEAIQSARLRSERR